MPIDARIAAKLCRVRVTKKSEIRTIEYINRLAETLGVPVDDILITLREFAAFVGHTYDNSYAMLKAGRVSYERRGTTIMVPFGEVKRYHTTSKKKAAECANTQKPVQRKESNNGR